MVRQAPVICVMAPPIHLGVWSMALMLLSFSSRMYICIITTFCGEAKVSAQDLSVLTCPATAVIADMTPDLISTDLDSPSQ